MKLTINTTGTSITDLTTALEIIGKQLEEGFTSGMDRGEGRSYSWDLEGKEEREPERKDQYSLFIESYPDESWWQLTSNDPKWEGMEPFIRPEIAKWEAYLLKRHQGYQYTGFRISENEIALPSYGTGRIELDDLWSYDLRLEAFDGYKDGGLKGHQLEAYHMVFPYHPMLKHYKPVEVLYCPETQDIGIFWSDEKLALAWWGKYGRVHDGIYAWWHNEGLWVRESPSQQQKAGAIQ